jgi:hypothetical protein
MQFKTNFQLPNLSPKISHSQNVLLLGSCFTEHISKRLSTAKMKVLQNPSGILFNPISVANCLNDLIAKKQYTANDFFLIHEAWQNWNIHSNFGNANIDEAMENINTPISKAHFFLQKVNWVIITLGSAFAYWHINEKKYVSNNHRASLDLFEKKLLLVDEIIETLQMQLDALNKINPSVQIIFTISPVRHLRDGLIDNNRSKARLIEATHSLVQSNANVQYFASYEIVLDELRDYRFYDIDFAHPNFMATEYVWQQFLDSAIDHNCNKAFIEFAALQVAFHHKPFNAKSEAHQSFLKANLQKCESLQLQYPYVNLDEEIAHFSNKS